MLSNLSIQTEKANARYQAIITAPVDMDQAPVRGAQVIQVVPISLERTRDAAVADGSDRQYERGSKVSVEPSPGGLVQ